MSAADLDLIETALKEAGMLCGWTMPAVRGPAGELWPDHMAQSTPFTEYIKADALAALARVRARQERAEAFLAAYSEASVSDEEGLLATTDYATFRALWQACDDAADALRAAFFCS